MRPAVDRLRVTVRAVMRVVLGLSLLVTFTTSAVALCLQAGQVESMAVVSAAPDSVSQDAVTQTSDRAAPVLAQSEHSPHEHACCLEQERTPQAIGPFHRLFPDPSSDALSHIKLRRVNSGDTQSGWFDPALKKPGHLRPLLTVMSISRT